MKYHNQREKVCDFQIRKLLNNLLKIQFGLRSASDVKDSSDKFDQLSACEKYFLKFHDEKHFLV